MSRLHARPSPFVRDPGEPVAVRPADPAAPGEHAEQVRAEQERDLLIQRYGELVQTIARRPSDAILRLLDIVLAGAALALLSPLLLAAMAAVRVSGGPALYRGERVGRGGRVFTMIKIRTLIPDAEQRLGPYIGPTLTRLTDAEVTPLGRMLRAGKVDELPQLWNVLRGDMSLVGPRPIRPAFFLELSRDIPAYWQRLVVRPGVTGLAQLRVTRETSWADKLAHDLEYIADRSPLLYLHVVLTTALLVLSAPLPGERRDVGLP